MAIPQLDIPNEQDINEWIEAWSETDPKKNKLNFYGYNAEKTITQESALNEYYKKHYNKMNKAILLNKIVLLNQYYATSINDTYTFCKNIFNNKKFIFNNKKFILLKIIKKRNLDVVTDIAQCSPRKNKQNGEISFASKFCHHHYKYLCPKKQNPFYIYDQYVVKMLLYCYDKDTDFKKAIDKKFQPKFHKYDLKGDEHHPRDYGNFVKIYKTFIEHYKNEMPQKYQKDKRNWDKYLWLAGKYGI